MRNANGSGSVFRLSGNRRRPYTAVISVGVELIEGKAKVKRKTLGYYATQKEARKALAEYNARNTDVRFLDVTFADIWERVKDDWFAELSKSAVKYYGIAWKHFEPLHDRRFTELKTDDFQAVVDPYPYSVQHHMKIVLNACYKYAMKNDIVIKNYAEYLQTKENKPTIERHIMSECVCGFEFAPISAFNDLTLILLYTGCRTKEILSNTTSFDTDNGIIHISEAKNKTSVRDIPIHPNIIECVKRWTETDKPTYNQYYGWLKRIGFTPHDCRHTFATRCHECGLNELVVQRIMGHTPDTILKKVYTHIGIEEMRSELSKLSYT